MPVFRNFLFDLDGTLANTLPLCVQAFREALEPLVQRPLSDGEIVATFGPCETGTVAQLAPGHQAEGVRRYLECYQALHHQWPAPFEGIVDVLELLKANESLIGLVTAKGRPSAECTLEQYELSHYFDVIKTGAPHGPIKDIAIEEIIADHQLLRGETLYVGDSPLDIEASRKCGIKVAAACWAPTANERELRALNPDYLFTEAADFLEYLQDLVPTGFRNETQRDVRTI